MDIISNPFSPGAGAPPRELAGRDDVLERARVLFARTKNKQSEKSMLLKGLRGVGKTVLLNEIDNRAKQTECKTIIIEALENKSFAELLAINLRTMLYELDRVANAGHKARRALSVLKSFLSGINLSVGELSIGIDAEVGSADSGNLASDLPNLLMAVAEAAEERGLVIVLLIDELQYLNEAELSALITAMHKMQQKQLPFVLLGAGLPILAGLAGDAKSYAERLFTYPNIGPLTKEDAMRALQKPVEKLGVHFEQEALDEIFSVTKGYPYFLQEWGYQCWNQAEASPITLRLVREATPNVIKKLDEDFFRVRFDRLTNGEKKFLYAMAQLGDGQHGSGDIASKLGRTTTSLGPTRASLIKKGMIYAPEHGVLDFTVPLFGEFMLRTMPGEVF